MPLGNLIERRPEGLYCAAGDFHIDPWRPVPRAVITHAHGDHLRAGCGSYLSHADAEPLVRSRIGEVAFEGLRYGEPRRIGDATISLHPAGHVLGSSQIRVEVGGEVWVVSGDYFLSAHDESNGTCTAFEPVRCHCFITESTFGLPIYHWQPQQAAFDEINGWWAHAAADGRTCVLYGYSLGKAQRLLDSLDASIGPIGVHPAVDRINAGYVCAGVALPPTVVVNADTPRGAMKGGLVVAPPMVRGSQWLRRLGPDVTDAFASGWMQLRGARRRQGVDRGFVVSDHADWPGLQRAIAATSADRVIVTHGYEAVMVRWLQQNSLQASSFLTEYGDEEVEPESPVREAPPADTRDAASDASTSGDINGGKANGSAS